MKEKLKKINNYEWKLDKSVRKGMNVNAKIIANKIILDTIEDEAINQLTNVAMLPGVIEPVIGLPDMHWGYGLPMGAVSAFDEKKGIISAGLCGFDINCGINLIRTNLKANQIKEKVRELADALFNTIPCGVGSKGKLKLTTSELDEVLIKGMKWALKNGYVTKQDLENTEENGCMQGANPKKVSDLAKKRGLQQLGTLGAGNHFLEVQKITDIFDKKTANKWGIKDKDQVTILVHCGSRGLGHQVATDYLKIQEKAVKKYNIELPDPQLVCAPVNSQEGKDFFSAMKCAVNYSFTNRAVMTKWIRETFEKVFGKTWQEMEMETVYAICHNVIKYEKHKVNGKIKNLYVHRKGATKSFPNIPVLLAGTMGTSSYLLKGTKIAMEKSFGSSAHGAGRAMSRHAAIKKFWGSTVQKELEKKGIITRATHPKSLAEENVPAYKPVEEVVNSVHDAGISTKVCKMVPLLVCKG